jgi:hypothetical protein
MAWKSSARTGRGTNGSHSRPADLDGYRRRVGGTPERGLFTAIVAYSQQLRSSIFARLPQAKWKAEYVILANLF